MNKQEFEELKFRTLKTREFLEKHRDCHEIIVDEKYKEPIQAVYHNLVARHYHDQELKRFFSHINKTVFYDEVEE